MIVLVKITFEISHFITHNIIRSMIINEFERDFSQSIFITKSHNGILSLSLSFQ